jgi:hypothetical protein
MLHLYARLSNEHRRSRWGEITQDDNGKAGDTTEAWIICDKEGAPSGECRCGMQRIRSLEAEAAEPSRIFPEGKSRGNKVHFTGSEKCSKEGF